MAMLTVRNIPDEVHRALRVRAALQGHSMEAEVRAILESAVSPTGRVKLGSLLADLGQQARMSDEEFAVFEQVRDKTPARPPGELRMILLDTHLVSEPLRAAPDAQVVAWMDGQPLETLVLSAITVAELRAGVALLPAGKRQAA